MRLLKSASKNFFLALLLMACCSLPSNAKEGKAFIHPFGELRVYYHDWLVVCEEKGQGVCRMVNMKLSNKKDHFFGNSQLTVYLPSQQPRKSAMPEYNNATFISFFNRDIPALEGLVTIAIDGKTVAQLQPNRDIFDSTSNEKTQKIIALETYWLEGDIATQVLNNMSTGRWLTVNYLQHNTRLTEKFSLSGATKAVAFI